MDTTLLLTQIVFLLVTFIGKLPQTINDESGTNFGDFTIWRSVATMGHQVGGFVRPTSSQMSTFKLQHFFNEFPAYFGKCCNLNSSISQNMLEIH